MKRFVLACAAALFFSAPASAGELDEVVDLLYVLAQKFKAQQAEIEKLSLRVRNLERELATLERSSAPNPQVLRKRAETGVKREKVRSFVVATLRPFPERVWAFIYSARQKGLEPRIAITPRKKLVVVVVKTTRSKARTISSDAYPTRFYRWENLIPVSNYDDVYSVLKSAFEADKNG
jgi:cell division protein FtsB